ncbi:hypothetical protein FGO68_gene8823 [Halteria grandinella]|uniref:F-box domain-containing protein n=1 Tax=Halteria grandinella TaxID=5974 RepID=A0A8J8NY10_HALGN|nr:hypothetical protein FGO68_gene8823 [Halteria grandinella]
MDSAQPFNCQISITNSLVSFSTIFEFFSIQELYQMQLISKKLYIKVIPHVFPKEQVQFGPPFKDFYYISKESKLSKVNESLEWSFLCYNIVPLYQTKWSSSIQVNEMGVFHWRW